MKCFDAVVQLGPAESMSKALWEMLKDTSVQQGSAMYAAAMAGALWFEPETLEPDTWAEHLDLKAFALMFIGHALDEGDVSPEEITSLWQ